MSLPRIPPTLVDAVRRNDCVLFVGAGLSQGAGLPGWAGLLNRILSWYDGNSVRLADSADVQRLIEKKELEQLLSRYISAGTYYYDVV